MILSELEEQKWLLASELEICAMSEFWLIANKLQTTLAAIALIKGEQK